MRGKGGLGQNARFKARITPAYAGKRVKISLKFRASAGKSSNVPSAFRCGRDHPRVCGEKAFVRSCCASRTGSPPRMRGKVCTYSATEHGYGITPAYAGKSLRLCILSRLLQDHPRVCGEKKNVRLTKNSLAGSPPRMRGKVPIVANAPNSDRITPAYAGKSVRNQRQQPVTGDHPRVCGEKDFSLLLSS